MLKRHIIIVSIIITSLMLMGCIQSTDTREKVDLDLRLAKLGFSDIKSIQSISKFQLHGWQYVNDQHLIIHSSPAVY